MRIKLGFVNTTPSVAGINVDLDPIHFARNLLIRAAFRYRMLRC
jgi:hypothetical protein